MAKGPDRPIINHLTDIDFYKFSMGQFIWQYASRVIIALGFRNRTEGIRLAHLIDEGELREQLEHARDLQFTSSELHYLGGTFEYGTRMFSEEYINFLKTMRLPDFHLERDGNGYRLEFEGLWDSVTYWETLALSIVTELYGRACLEGLGRFERDRAIAESRLRLGTKLDLLRRYPHTTFSDFGTRRRFSFDHQDYIVGVLTEVMQHQSFNQFIGTSNVWLANKYGVMPMGTSAHELFMVFASLGKPNTDEDTDEAIRASQLQVLKLWWELYGQGLSIALTDTYGTPWFFRNVPREVAVDWKGTRQDSMDPYHYGELAIQFYKKHCVFPQDKFIVFSDGLEAPVIVKLAQHFCGRIKTTFGWGTNLTNDVPGCRPLSLIIKPIRVNGKGTVKLSDNIAKATGTPEDIERFVRIFEYHNSYNKKCTY